jgi:type IV secretory pathway VirD2 relaxase
MSTPTPEERASALCDAIDDSRLAPASAADRPALVAMVAEAVRKAQRDAALEMRERCAALAEEFPVHWVDVSAGESYLAGPVHEEIADAVRALEV